MDFRFSEDEEKWREEVRSFIKEQNLPPELEQYDKQDCGIEGQEWAYQFQRKLIEGLQTRIEHVYLNGHPQKRLPNNINVSIDSIEGESMLLNLDLEGICVSTGSACTSSSLEPSYILSAMGLSPGQALSSVRPSLGKWTAEEDIERVLEVLPRIVAKLRAMSSLLN